MFTGDANENSCPQYRLEERDPVSQQKGDKQTPREEKPLKRPCKLKGLELRQHTSGESRDLASSKEGGRGE